MEEEITVADLKAAIRRATIANKLVPIAGGSAFKNKGVQYLVDAVVDYLPSPLDIPAREAATSPDDLEKEGRGAHRRQRQVLLPRLQALGSDKYRRQARLLPRLLRHRLQGRHGRYNPRTGRKERVGRLIQMQADKHEEIETCYAGDIAAIVGSRTSPPATPSATRSSTSFSSPRVFPEPVISMAVEPRTKADQDKMAIGLARLSEEDPTFVVKTDEETGQTIISGMGELHLEVIIDRLKREFSRGQRRQAPDRLPRDHHRLRSRRRRESSSQADRRAAANTATSSSSVTPNEKGKGLTTENTVVGGAIPKDFINAVMTGVRESMTNGIVAGYPVVDVHVNVKDGSYHEVDSNENAFKMAAIFAMRDALQKASPILLEPVMDVEVTTPDEYQGDIMGDLNRRRAHISGIETKGNACNVHALVPLAEMFGYMTDLRTISSGRASFTMEPASFEPVPPAVLSQIVTARGMAA